jgi:hypothetical protein
MEILIILIYVPLVVFRSLGLYTSYLEPNDAHNLRAITNAQNLTRLFRVRLMLSLEIFL